MKKFLTLIMASFIMLGSLSAKEGVILLHGLCRSSATMNKMAKSLQASGYVVENVSYPSRKGSIKHLAEQAISSAMVSEKLKHCSRVHFVTHSMGGILVRSYFHGRKDQRLGRVVMLAPPNQGSEVVDKIGDWKVTRWINGSAGSELGTGQNSTPNQLGRVNFECGILTGNRSINWINSTFIPGKDDGKVSVARSKITGMKDHKVIKSSHPFIMKNRVAIAETIHFLRTGRFIPCSD